ncbi:MAG: hypothetical protein ACJAVI_005086 [Candidatus Azotimanducaceae bacterium]|jgi:hypothetical protein
MFEKVDYSEKWSDKRISCSVQYAPLQVVIVELAKVR